MKKTTKILSLALVAMMLFALTACFKQEGTIGAVVDQKEVDEVVVALEGLDSEQYTVNGATKDAVFTFILNNQKLTEDEARISAVRDSLEASDVSVNVTLHRSEGEDMVIMVNKDTGDFVIGYHTAEGNIDYRYASPEGEGFDIEAIMEIVKQYQ